MIKGVGPFPAMGLNGAAYATAFSQFVSVAVSMVYLKMKTHIVKANPFDFAFDFNITKLMLQSRASFAAMQLIVSVSWLLLNRIINTYGESASAAVAVSMRVDFFIISSAFGIISRYRHYDSAEYIGAGKMERVNEIFKSGVKLSVGISTFMAIFSILFPEIIVRMFTKDMKCSAVYQKLYLCCYAFYNNACCNVFCKRCYQRSW